MSLALVPGPNRQTLRVRYSERATPSVIMSMRTPRFGPPPRLAGLTRYRPGQTGRMRLSGLGDIWGDIKKGAVEVGEVVTEVADVVVPIVDSATGGGGTGTVVGGVYVPPDPGPRSAAGIVEGMAGGAEYPAFWLERYGLVPQPGPRPLTRARWDPTPPGRWYIPGIVVTTLAGKQKAQHQLNSYAMTPTHGLAVVFAALEELLATSQWDAAKKTAESLSRSLMQSALIEAVALGMSVPVGPVSAYGANAGKLASDLRNEWLLHFAGIVQLMPETSRPDTSAMGIKISPDVDVPADSATGQALLNAGIGYGAPGAGAGAVTPDGATGSGPGAPGTPGAPQAIPPLKMGMSAGQMGLGLAALGAVLWMLLR